MQFRLKITFVKGCHNVAADALSRVFDDMPEEHRKEFLPQQDEREDFVVSVTETDSSGPSLKEDNVKGEDSEVRLYPFEWNEGIEVVGDGTQLNPQSSVFVPRENTIGQTIMTDGYITPSNRSKLRSSGRMRQLVTIHVR